MEISPIELVIGLLVVAIGLGYVARWIGIAYPILLLLGGLVLGFLPGLPEIELDPDLVFLLLLPPILFGAGFSTPIRDFKANARPIALLAVGLVLFTTVVVGVVAQAVIPGLPAAAAFGLGAIVAPPDAVAATAIFRRLGVPRRVVTILEGESLVNDATAIILYRFAIAAAATGLFSIADAGFEFVRVGVGGILVGVVVGLVVTEAWRRTSDPTLEIMVSLLAPFAAYLPAEALHVSGVLATVVAGLIAGRRAARTLSPGARLMGNGVWNIVIYIINGFAFMLIGLQLPAILRELSAYTTTELLTWALVISATVILARIAWVFPATYLPRLSRRVRSRDPAPPWQSVVVVSWAGMRGAVSLAAALALPLTPPFPDRDLVIFLTFCVILATLVGQGLTLPYVVRRLGVMAVTGPDAEEGRARMAATEAALSRLTDLELEYPTHRELIDNLRTRYEHEARHADADGPRDEEELELLEHKEIRDAVLDAEREAVIGLRDEGIIGDEVLQRVERDLDLEALRSEA